MLGKQMNIVLFTDTVKIKSFICHIIDELNVLDKKVVESMDKSGVVPDEILEKTERVMVGINNCTAPAKNEIMEMEDHALLAMALDEITRIYIHKLKVATLIELSQKL